MPFHELVQRLLLLGVHLRPAAAAPNVVPPPALLPLIEHINSAYETFDRRAIQFGDRYRSGFWSIYLLSAIAVLFAVLPLALGWDSEHHRLHPYAGAWAIAEVLVIVLVSIIYWRGRRRDWQAEWLRARTTAELSWYLPMLAPLLNLHVPGSEPNWYLRIFDPGQDVKDAGEISGLCARTEVLARDLLKDVWSDQGFVAGYARWTIDILSRQQDYHRRTAHKHHALLHRVHAINGYLFGLTALGATLHLFVHSLWLSLVTTFFPALGASLHGALAQSEAHRLESTSQRLVKELQDTIDDVRAAFEFASTNGDTRKLKAAIEAAIALVLDEHQDWHLLVRPHHLPLA
jgi:hypothetical protein